MLSRSSCKRLAVRDLGCKWPRSECACRDQTTISSRAFPEHRARETHGLGGSKSLRGWRGEVGPSRPLSSAHYPSAPLPRNPSLVPFFFSPGDPVSRFSHGPRHRHYGSSSPSQASCIADWGQPYLVWVSASPLSQLCSVRFLRSHPLEVPPTEMVETSPATLRQPRPSSPWAARDPPS